MLKEHMIYIPNFILFNLTTFCIEGRVNPTIIISAILFQHFSQDSNFTLFHVW